MTIKQNKFVKVLVKTGNATEAAAQAYSVKDRSVARSIGTENLAKPAIQHALAGYNQLFENTITKTVQEWGASDDTGQRSLAVKTAQWGFEQIHGKATQRTESVSASFIQHTSDKASKYAIE